MHRPDPPPVQTPPAAPGTDPVPTRREVLAVLDAYRTDASPLRSSAHLALSAVLTAVVVAAAVAWIPTAGPWSGPLWFGYAVVCGTVAFGLWVIAHECGHFAFGGPRWAQSAIGFVLHSVWLVPYFSWQRSHAIHHAATNHVVRGETHVPKLAESAAAGVAVAVRRRLGTNLHAALSLTARLLFGWPLYLLLGRSGGLERGTTNHFWPWRPFSDALFPKRWKPKVVASTAGVALTVAVLGVWGVQGSWHDVLRLYVGPYLVGNCWLVAYTWLHHTDADVPHYDGDEWTFVRGAFCSIDRPYGPLIDTLHHRIGSTHAVHHLASYIPHYRAAAITTGLAEAFPSHYRYDPTPIPVALWRTARDCAVVRDEADVYHYIDLDSPGSDVEGSDLVRSTSGTT